MVIGGEVDCVKGMGPDTVHIHGVLPIRLARQV
jgi:hypothetical protein